MASFIKFMFTGKTPLELILTISTLIFYLSITPVCLAIFLIGTCIYGFKRWSEMCTKFNNTKLIVDLNGLLFLKPPVVPVSE